MKIIDKIFCKLFNTKGGFDFTDTYPYGVIKRKYKWYPEIHIYDNTWYLFIQLEYKTHGFQFNIWNHYKYQEYINFESPDPNDYNTEIENNI